MNLTNYKINNNEIIHFLSSLNTEIEFKNVISIKEHMLIEFSGWSPLITLQLKDLRSNYYDVDVRYAYGPEIFKQFLVDHGYNLNEFLNIQSSEQNDRRKLIIYLCDKSTKFHDLILKKEISGKFIIGNYWKSIDHIYVSIENNSPFKILIFKMNRDIIKVSGFATTANNIFVRPSNLNVLNSNPARKAEGGLRCKGIYKNSKVGKPLISIITPVYNGKELIEQTIQSVINQNYDNVEYIIIDGGSTDGTLDIIRKYEDQIDYWVSEPDEGVFNAYDKGIRIAQGKYIGTINADDFYNFDTLNKIFVQINKDDHKSDFYFGDLIIVKDSFDKRLILSSGSIAGLAKRNSLNYPTFFFKKEHYINLGGFDNQFKISADYDLELRFISHGYRGEKINEILAFFRQGGLSSHSLGSLKENFYIFRKHQLNIFYFLFKVLKMIPIIIFKRVIGNNSYIKIKDYILKQLK